jgi:hypothetical protein
MEQPVIVIGLGQMGAVFAHALLRSGHPVVPVLRSTPPADAAREAPDPALVLVTVGEDDLPEVLERMPEPWKDRVGLIQNELLPRDWRAHGIDDPTVAAVWFEKKPDRPTTAIIPTPVAGPAADLIASALATIDIEATAIPGDRLVEALVTKNLYILTTNIAGLPTGGTVSDLWDRHRPLAEAVASEVLDIQEWLVGAPVDRERALAGMLEAFASDPEHATTGRSARRRLERALAHARAAGIATPRLEEIGRTTARTV